VAADSARPLAHYLLDGARQPAFLVNEFGKGRAIYLNFIPSAWQPVFEKKKEDDPILEEPQLQALASQRIHRVLDEIVRIAGLTPPVECDTPLFARYGEGPISYVCLAVGYKGDPASWRRPCPVRLREKQHVYDARRRTYLGFTDQFEARFSFEDKLFVLVYSAMPYRVEGIAMDLERETVKPGGTLHFTARLQPREAQKQRHCLALRVKDPEGMDVLWYQCVIETQDGVAKGRVDFALNDKPGKWVLHLTDTATGTAAEKACRVE
jgi:hypothetical protein